MSKAKSHSKISFSGLLKRLDPKHLDMVGSEVKFKYGDQERVKTGLGGSLTLMVILATLAAIYSAAEDLILRPKPEV